MSGALKLCCAKAPLYARFSAILGLVVCACGFGIPPHGAILGRVLIVAVLLRRLCRSLLRVPSRHCTFRGVEMEASVEGLHRRFAELYISDKQDTEPEGSAESLVLQTQQMLTLEDGQCLAFWDVGPKSCDGGAILVCNGLGARVMTWAPLLDALHSASPCWAQRRFVIFDYRGQFDSQPLAENSEITVKRSAADAAALAKHLKLRRCSLLCWSTGVQVGLQLALDRPELVEAMVLIQGTTGDAMKALLQPLCHVPGVPSFLEAVLRHVPSLLLRRGRREFLHGSLCRNTSAFEKLGRCMFWFFGSDLIAPAGVRYTQDMLQSDQHFRNYCGYALALGQHKVLWRLPEIKAPALVVTGTPDFITPARCSYDMAALLGGPTVLVDDISGSHYYIYEEPQKLALEMVRFLDKHAPPEPGV